MNASVKIFVVILVVAISVCGQEARQNGNVATQGPAILKEPTVLATGATWAVISWTTNAAGKAHTLVYGGTDRKNMKPMPQTIADPANNGNGMEQSYHEQQYSHLVRLNNLKPGTTYYFMSDCGSVSNHNPASKSNVWTFTTSGSAPAAATLSVSKRPARKPSPDQAQAQKAETASTAKGSESENITGTGHKQ